MRNLWLYLALAGCHPAQDEESWGDQPLPHVGPADVAQVASPPQELTLELTSLWPGAPATWRVSGLQPGETVRIARARSVGSDVCLPVAGDLCLDLAGNPSLFQTLTADGLGVATLTRTVPSTLPLGRSAAFQAVAVRGSGGVSSVKSNAVLRVTRPVGEAATPFGERPVNPTCVAFERPTSTASVQLDPVYQGVSLSLPVAMVQAPGDASVWYAAELSGRVVRFSSDPQTNLQQVALDFRSRVVSGNELGFLSLAFHPDFASNGYLYVYYTGGSSGSPVSRISRFQSLDGGESFAASTESVIFSVAQPASNHNGGTLAFGPDGYLYLSLGDGGSANDPWNNAQNTDNVLGGIMRIDVDGGTPYAIPPDNPFAGGGGAAELYAWGLRNPYRWSFDRQTGELWAGDVGQDQEEEIDLIERGGNYGWRIREGNRCIRSVGCNNPDFIDPVYAYAHTSGPRSVIGGYVYRGSRFPNLVGTYLFAEFYTGEVQGLSPTGSGNYAVRSLVTQPGLQISSFAEDISGELYVLDYAGQVYAVRDSSPSTSATPRWLSQTGCFDPADPTVPVDAMIPYVPIAPLWSDGLEKRRWFAIPDDTVINQPASLDWTLPIGSVTAKEFSFQGERVETRLFVRHDDGQWGAYSYVWDPDAGDAYLVTAGVDLDLDGLAWSVPSQTECFACHTNVAGWTLGLETAQLNHPLDYGPATANQLAHLQSLNLFGLAPGDPSTLPSLAALDDLSASAEDRARAALHANCAMCHRVGGTGLGGLDLHWSTSLEDTQACGVVPTLNTLGIANAELIAPGDPDRSVLLERMRTTGLARMPPLATRLEDQATTAVISDWITGLTTCP